MTDPSNRAPATGTGAQASPSDPLNRVEQTGDRAEPESLAAECARLRDELQAVYDARTELQRVNHQMSLILDQLPVIPYTCRAEGDFGATYMGPSITRVAGYLPEQLVSHPPFWAERIHPDDRPRVFDELGALFEHGHHEHEYRWRIADGSYRWFFDSLRLIRDERGEPAYIVGTWLDISERKRAERTLRQQRQFLRTLLDAIPDLISAHDATGRVTTVNRAFSEYTNIDPAETIGQPIEELVGGNQGLIMGQLVEEVLRSRVSKTAQIQLGETPAEVRTIETTLVPHGEKDADERGVIAIGRDVTERERALAGLHRAKEQAEFASRAKSEFLANMSHEIRTPLNSILGYSQLLGKRASDEAFPIYVLEYLEHINVSGYNLSEIINNILELSKIEDGKVTISSEPLDLSLLLRRVHGLSRLRAAEKGIEFTFRHDQTLPRAVRTDRAKVTQILNNLLSNAIKFTPPGKRISLEVERRDSTVLFTVSDEGIGIAPAKQAGIFDEFAQADSSLSRRYGGTGLGLAICRRLSELLGGRIWLHSEVGVGTSFFVELPLVDATEGFRDATRLDEVPRFAKDSKILVVEDNPMNQAVLRDIFEELGLGVTIAEDGEAGVRAAVEMRPECIFMDLHMPGLDGLQATRQLRELPEFAETPIIALTADAFAPQRMAALEAGITDYLIKPILLGKLVAKLSTYLRNEVRSRPEPRHVLDAEGLAEYSAALFEKLRDMFMQMVPSTLAELRQCARARDFQRVTEQAHTLKNYGMGMFATRFTGVSIELELESRSENLHRVEELISELEWAYEDAVAALTRWAAKQFSSDPE